MKTIKVLVVLCLTFLCGNVLRADGLYFGIGLGSGEVDIDEEFFPGVTSPSTDSNKVGIGDFLVGHEFSNGLFVDLGIEGYDTVDIFGFGDQVDFGATRLGIGYFVPSESRINVYGKTGISFWQLELTESSFLNPGSEESGKRSGEDPFLQFGIEYHFNERFRLGLSYSYISTDFGDASGGKLIFKWFP